MIKQAKAGKPIDMDAVPPPVAIGSAQPSAPASSPPAVAQQAVPAVEDLGSNDKPTKLDQDTMPTLSQDGTFAYHYRAKLLRERAFFVNQGHFC